MKYGYFDDVNREYVIDHPNTPKPWVNYLGSPEYGAIISNNAGGYSFAKSGANGRILRYVFNNFDQPGRYIYLRDDDTKDFWSASWQPVGKDLKDYHSECHHGMGYTKMIANYSGIHSKASYYVPKDKSYEVWAITVTNRSEQTRHLTLTGYAEFTTATTNKTKLTYNIHFLSHAHFSKITASSNKSTEILIPLVTANKLMKRMLLNVSSVLAVLASAHIVETKKAS